MSLFDRRAVLAAVVAAGLAVAGMAAATTAARASAGCEVDYTVSSQWQGGFGANITVTDQGHIYRSTSAVSQFPNGFGDGGNTVIAASAPNKYDMFEADNVYKVDGSNTYLMVVEAIGSDGHRLFHSWTSTSLTGSWTPLAATQSNPFLAASNTTFSGNSWTQDLSSGEAIRSGYDQTVTISPCHLQYLYQGKDPSANQSYNLLPWRIGLATQTNSTC